MIDGSSRKRVAMSHPPPKQDAKALLYAAAVKSDAKILVAERGQPFWEESKDLATLARDQSKSVKSLSAKRQLFEFGFYASQTCNDQVNAVLVMLTDRDESEITVFNLSLTLLYCSCCFLMSVISSVLKVGRHFTLNDDEKSGNSSTAAAFCLVIAIHFNLEHENLHLNREMISSF